MLYVYLFAAVLGWVLVGTSLVSGDHASADGGGDGDAHSDALGFLSPRLWTHVLALGGSTGLALTWLTQSNPAFVALVAVSVGLAGGITSRLATRRAQAMGTGGTVRDADLVGHAAEVLTPFAKGTTGTVRLQIRNSTVDLLAICDDSDLGAGDQVLVVAMKNGSALVARDPTALPRPGGNGNAGV